nr:hypothetical protein Iba_chr05cCG6980 [Ipomoea batatas]
MAVEGNMSSCDEEEDAVVEIGIVVAAVADGERRRAADDGEGTKRKQDRRRERRKKAVSERWRPTITGPRSAMVVEGNMSSCDEEEDAVVEIGIVVAAVADGERRRAADDGEGLEFKKLIIVYLLSEVLVVVR